MRRLLPFKKRPFYGWWIVAVGFIDQLCAAGFGVYAFSVLIKPMADDESLGWSRTDLVWGVTLGVVIATGTGPLFGAFLDKRNGPRLVMVALGITGGLGLALLSQVHRLWAYLLLFGVVSAFFMNSTIFLVVPTVVSKWFVRHRGRALIFSTMGRPLSGLLMLPLTEVLASTVGWRDTWLILGVLTAVIVTPLNAFFFHGKPEDLGLNPDGDPPVTYSFHQGWGRPQKREASWTLALAMKTPSFWFVLLATNLSGAGIMGVLVNQVAYLKESFSDGVAVAGATLITAMSFISRLGWLLVADRFPPRYTTSVTFVLCGLGMIFLIFADNIPMMVLWALTFGPGISGMDPLLSLIWASYYGREFLGSIRGFVTMTNVVTTAGAPLMAAAIFDATGSYQIAFTIFLAAFFAAAIVMPFAPPPQVPQSKQALGLQPGA